MTAPRIEVGIGADVSGLDAGFREGLQNAQRFAEKLKTEMETKLAQIGQAAIRGLISPQEAQAAGAAVGREYAKAINLEVAAAKRELSTQAPTREGYLSGLAGELKALETTGGGAAAGLTALRRPLTALFDEAVGVSGPIGNIASRLGLMAAGGPIIVGVLAGMAALAAIYEVVTAKASAAQAEIDASAKRIEALRNEASSPIQFAVDVANAKKKIDELAESAGRYLGIAASIRALVPGGALLAAAIENHGDAQLTEAAGLGGGLQVAPGKQLKDEAADLARVITERIADNTQRARAVAIIREQRAEVAKLQAVQGGSDAEQRQRTHDMGEAAATAHTLEQAFDGVAKKGAAAEHAIAAMATRQQSAREAFGSAIAAQSPGREDNDAATLRARVDQATAAHLTNNTIAELTDAFDMAQGARMEEASRKLTAKLRAELVNGIGEGITAARQALQEFDREIEENRRQGIVADPTVVAGVRAQKEALANAADEAKRLHDLLATIGEHLADGGGAIQAMRQLDDELDRASAAVRATKDGTIENTAALQREHDVRAKITALQTETATKSKEAAAAARQVESATQHVAGEVAAAASAAAGLATAFFGANSEVSHLLVGVAGVATGVGKIADAATKAGGLGKLLSTGKGIASIIPEIGGIVAGGGAIASALQSSFGESPADRAHREAVEANTRALASLAQHLGDLAGLTIGGGAFASVRTAVDRLVGATSGAAFAGRAHLDNTDAFFGANGTSAADVEAVAKTLGITLDGTVDGFRKLDAAIKASDFQAFADSWAGAMAEFDDVTRIDGVNDPLARLKAYASTALAKSGSSLIQSFLQGADLNSAEGRAAVRQSARAWFQAVLDGTIDPSTFGKLNTSEILQFLETFIGDVDAVVPAAAAASNALDVLGGRLSDIALLADLTADATDSIYKSIDAAVTAFPQFADAIRGLIAGLDVTTPQGQQAFRGRVAGLARSLATDGLSDGERAFLQFLDTLLHNLPPLADATASAASGVDTLTTSVGGLGDAVRSLSADVSDITGRIQSDGELLGKTQAQIDQDQADAFNKNPDLQGLFGHTDPNDPAGLARQKTHAQALLADQQFSTPDVADAVRGFLKYVNGLLGRGITLGPGEPATVSPESGRIGAEAIGANAAQATRVGDLLAGMFATERDELATLQAIRAAVERLSPAALSPIEPPSLPGFGARGGGWGGGDATVSLSFGDVVIEGAGALVAAGDARGLALRIQQELVAMMTADPNNAFRRAIGRMLGDDYRFAQSVTGGRVVS